MMQQRVMLLLLLVLLVDSSSARDRCDGARPDRSTCSDRQRRAVFVWSPDSLSCINVSVCASSNDWFTSMEQCQRTCNPLPADCLTTVKTRCPSAASRYTKPVAVYTYDQSSYQCRKIRIIGCPTNGSNVFNNMTNCMHHCPTITETTPTTTETTPAVYSTISKPHSLLSHAGKTYQEASGTGNIISSGSLIRPSFVGLLLSIFFLS